MSRFFYKAVSFCFTPHAFSHQSLRLKSCLYNHKRDLIDEVSIPDKFVETEQQINYIIKLIDSWVAPLSYCQFRTLRDQCEAMSVLPGRTVTEDQHEVFKYLWNRNLSSKERYHLFQFLKCYGLRLWSYVNWNSEYILNDDWESQINALEKVILLGQDSQCLLCFQEDELPY